MPLLSSCIGFLGSSDGSSVSVGTHALGALIHSARLPARGDAWLVPSTWAARERSYATGELVGALVRAARQVRRQRPGAVLGVADLSPLGGGGAAEHRSHASGRDVDLLYYSTDARGRSLPPPDAMLAFAASGWSKPARDGAGRRVPRRRFDDAGNWALLRALLEDPGIEVQWLFVHRALRSRLLAHAEAHGADPVLVARAAALMHQPSDAQSHNDHLHLRIYCPRSDRPYGCFDRGPQRWRKKLAKYFARPEQRSAAGAGGDIWGRLACHDCRLLTTNPRRLAHLVGIARLGGDLGVRAGW